MLDQELRALVSVDPSPEFEARIRTTIASQPVRSRGFRWWQPMAAVVMLALLAIVAGRWPDDIDEVQALRSTGTWQMAAPAGAAAMHRPDRHVDATPVDIGSRRKTVQINAAEAAALQQLLAQPPTALAIVLDETAVEPADDSATGIVIPELSIAPLRVGAPLGEGATR